MKPTRKVGMGGLAGAVALVIIWVLGMFGVPVPPEVAGAMVTILMFATSYLTNDR